MGCIFSSHNDVIIPKQKTKQKHILYLEDMEIHYDLLRLVMSKYTKDEIILHWSTNSNDAKKILNQYPIDGMIVDRKLNNELGEDFVGYVLNNNLFDPKKIIILSALSENEAVKTFIDNGVKYMQKPMDIIVLKDYIEEI